MGALKNGCQTLEKKWITTYNIKSTLLKPSWVMVILGEKP
jgi:hypothetical protein